MLQVNPPLVQKKGFNWSQVRLTLLKDKRKIQVSVISREKYKKISNN